MKRTIYKYMIGWEWGGTTINLPKHADVLSWRIDPKDDNPYIWVRLDPTETLTDMRTFKVFATGEPSVPELGAEFIGTCFCENGGVWHLFEMKYGEQIQ